MQQHGSKYLPAAPPPSPQPSPQKVKIQLFQNMVMLHIKGNRECSNMVATADRGTINMKHIKRDFWPVSDPLGGLRGWDQKVKYVLKRVSFGSKDCTKELKLECAYFLGQTS